MIYPEGLAQSQATPLGRETRGATKDFNAAQVGDRFASESLLRKLLTGGESVPLAEEGSGKPHSNKRVRSPIGKLQGSKTEYATITMRSPCQGSVA